MRKRARRRLIVPAVLAVTVTTAVALAASTVGCGDDSPPRTDAGITDGPVDTPIV